MTNEELIPNFQFSSKFFGTSSDDSPSQTEKFRRESVASRIENFERRNPHNFHSSEALISSEACERLYKLGILNQKMKATKIKIARVQENKPLPPMKLDISTRSYTPSKPRPYESHIASVDDFSNVHNYLFYLSKEKRAEINIQTGHEDERKISTREKEKVINRLYSRSISLQHEGRERREKIAQALAPKPQIQYKKISLNKATAMYDRQIAHKAARDQRIAEAQVFHPRPFKARDIGELVSLPEPTRGRSQTPNPRSSLTPIRGRSLTPSRVRSRTPIRERSQTHHRSNSQIPTSRERAQTPNFRLISQSRFDYFSTPQRETEFGDFQPQTRSTTPSRNFRLRTPPQ